MVWWQGENLGVREMGLAADLPKANRKEAIPSSRNCPTCHRQVELNFSSPTCIKKLGYPKGYPSFLVRVFL